MIAETPTIDGLFPSMPSPPVPSSWTASRTTARGGPDPARPGGSFSMMPATRVVVPVAVTTMRPPKRVQRAGFRARPRGTSRRTTRASPRASTPKAAPSGPAASTRSSKAPTCVSMPPDATVAAVRDAPTATPQR